MTERNNSLKKTGRLVAVSGAALRAPERQGRAVNVNAGRRRKKGGECHVYLLCYLYAENMATAPTTLYPVIVTCRARYQHVVPVLQKKVLPCGDPRTRLDQRR